MKRIIFLLFLVTSMQLEATTMRIKHDQVTYDYDMSANTAVVVELEKNFSGSLTIPNTLDLGRDNPVVVGVADNAFKEQTGLRKITLPESVTYIGKPAFYGCKALQSVTIPKNVKRIEFATFQGCGSLSTVVIPEGMEYIAQWAFLACSALESIDIPKTVNEIGESAFSYTGLTAVNIPGRENHVLPTWKSRLPLGEITWAPRGDHLGPMGQSRGPHG